MSIPEIIKSTLKKEKISLEKLSQETNISLNNLKALEEGDFSRLPAKVFIRGYFKKISQYLDLNFEEIWSEYLRESEVLNQEISQKKYSQDGQKNKIFRGFAARRSTEKNKKINFKKIKISHLNIFFIFLIIFFIVLLLVIQAKNLFGPPKLEVDWLANDFSTEEEFISLSGRGEKNSYIGLNGKEIYLGEDGRFQENIYLNLGINEVKIEAESNLGRKKIINYFITRKEKMQEISSQFFSQ